LFSGTWTVLQWRFLQKLSTIQIETCCKFLKENLKPTISYKQRRLLSKSTCLQHENVHSCT
jgi:hypothetical protein